jgi:hypothetical protein
LVVSKIRPGGKGPLNIVLSEAIQACLKENVLSPRTASLSDVIRGYRNLIHPGRVIRLQETFGENSAKIALSLVEIITSEVAKKRKENYGLTAEQIVRKISIDERAMPLIPHLLSETKEHERRRLVNGVIAESFTPEGPDWLANSTKLATLKKCYRLALSSLSEADQIGVAVRFAQMVRQESSEKITRYADTFFSCEDLRHLPSNDRALVKNHIFARLEALKLANEFPPEFLESLRGIGPYLEGSDVIKFANMCIRFSISGTEDSQTVTAKLLIAEYGSMEAEELKAKIESHIGIWLKHVKEKKFAPEKIKRLEYLASNCSEIPF